MLSLFKNKKNKKMYTYVQYIVDFYRKWSNGIVLSQFTFLYQ